VEHSKHPDLRSACSAHAFKVGEDLYARTSYDTVGLKRNG